jgi:predicted 2-oxoglutarate/Fe(II)-dependent dioxygenase YbiX
MKFLKHKNLTIIFDFLESSEVSAFDFFMKTNTWSEAEGDPHWSMNISSAEIGLIAQTIQQRLKNTIETVYKCTLSNETLGTLVKYKVGHGLKRHYDAALIEETTGKMTVYQTFSGHPSRDISSTIYLGQSFEGGEIYFPNIDFTYEPVQGSVIIFPSSEEYEHEVTPVVNGDRIMASIFWHKFNNK